MKVENLKKLNQQYFQLLKLKVEKKYDQVISGCKKIILQDPTFYKIYILLAEISKKQNQLNQANQYLQALLTKEPDNPYFHYGLGLCHKEQKNHILTKAAFQKSIELKPDFLWAYLALVRSPSNKNDASELIDYFKEEIESNPNNSLFFWGLGHINEYKLRKYDLALKYYLQGLETAQKMGESILQGEHYTQIGNYFFLRGKYPKALGYYEKAVETGEKTRNIRRLALYLSNYALTFNYLGKYNRGIEYYNRALEVAKEVSDKIREFKVLRGIGYGYYALGKYSQSLKCYNQALRIAKESANIADEGSCLRGIANVHKLRGSYQSAINIYKKALKIAQTVGNKWTEGNCLYSLGGIFYTTGNFSKGLEYSLLALKVAKENGKKALEANCYHNIANIYQSTGNNPKALEYYQLSLKMQREMGTKLMEGLCLHNIGGVYLSQNKYSQAMEHFKQGLTIAQETKMRDSEIQHLEGIAQVHSKLGDYPRSLEFYEKSLKIAKEIGSKNHEASILYNLGKLWFKQKRFDLSLNSFTRSLSIAQDQRLAWVVWASYSGLASLYDAQGKYNQALSSYKKAIDIIEGIRAKIQLKEQKSGFLMDKTKIYESVINLLFELHQKQPSMNYNKELTYFVEKAKARTFLDGLQENKINLKANLPIQLRDEENKITREFSKIQTALVKPGLSKSKREELFQLLKRTEDNYQHLVNKIKRNKPEYASIVYPDPCKLAEIQNRLLSRETAIIEYFLGEKNSFMFCITPNDFQVKKLSSTKNLNDSIHAYLKLLSNPKGKNFKGLLAGRHLYKILIHPFREKIRGIEYLIIIPDGKLHYLPFETLVVADSEDKTKTKYLVESYKISYAPSASSLINLLTRKREAKIKKDLLAFADPVYTFKETPGLKIDAERILRDFYLDQGFSLHPLKYSGIEVKKISKLIKKGARDIYTKHEAKEETVKKLSLKDYKIIHFATHGLLDEEVVGRSGLVLTLDNDPQEDGFYQVREIYNNRLNANLVVLSACQTGKGKLEKGEGVSGLSRAFLHAGAESVVVSLWNINDKSTALFMTFFYEYLVQGKTKVEALRLAKLKMINNQYSHPYYWAAFVLIGDYNSQVQVFKRIQ
jgi:CHAT domain-containing protein/Tfp pilus assembly protein PilF